MTGIDDLIICPRCLKSMGEINTMICPHCGYDERKEMAEKKLFPSVLNRVIFIDTGHKPTREEIFEQIMKDVCRKNFSDILRWPMGMMIEAFNENQELREENEYLKEENKLLKYIIMETLGVSDCQIEEELDRLRGDAE